jgi:hypothetical protein
MAIGINSKHARTPFQFAAGCGALQRSSPIGGAANGIPLKTVILGSAAGSPRTIPFSVLVTRSMKNSFLCDLLLDCWVKHMCFTCLSDAQLKWPFLLRRAFILHTLDNFILDWFTQLDEISTVSSYSDNQVTMFLRASLGF